MDVEAVMFQFARGLNLSLKDCCGRCIGARWSESKRCARTRQAAWSGKSQKPQNAALCRREWVGVILFAAKKSRSTRYAATDFFQATETIGVRI